MQYTLIKVIYRKHTHLYFQGNTIRCKGNSDIKFCCNLLASFTPAVDERFMLSYQDGSVHDMEGRYSN